jgi:hypothetical protein
MVVTMTVIMMVMTVIMVGMTMIMARIVTMAVVMRVILSLTLESQTKLTSLAIHLHLTQLGFHFPFPNQFQ